MDQILSQIQAFADQAHGNQKRKFTPERYIVHPTRVMEICKQYTNDQAILAAALLHDVLEDTETKKETIQEFLLSLLGHHTTQRTIQLVVELTDIYVKKNYPEWNRRKRKTKEFDRLEKISPNAQTIKYADIIDNSGDIAAQDPDFADLYLRESIHLLQKINKGNPALHQRAIETVQIEIELLKRS